MAFAEITALIQGKWPGWEVVRLIGKGSYGTVYEINDNGASGKLNMAALKVISIPEEGTALPIGQDMNSLNTYYSSIAETMKLEYGTALKLKSGNVVECDGYVEVPNDNGIGLKLLIKMELLTDLNSHIRKSGFSRQDVIRLGIDICRALEICRVNHVFHRDIKPANLFVSADRTYKLGDFGVAKRLEETGYAGSKQGTILYMAPEVYANRDYDHRADLYSLGLVMYQLLNKGQLPFMAGALNERSQGESLRKRMRGDIIPMPATENGDLAEIVLRACRYDYRERYTDPVQMRWALEKLLDTMDRKMVIAPVDTRPEVRIRFMDPDGTVLHARNYRQGEKLMIPAVPKEKVKNGLVLQFEKWEPPLPETATMTMDFSATYKKVPQGNVSETGKGKKEKQKKKTKRKAGGWIAAVLCVLLASAGVWAYLSGNLGTIGKETPPSAQVSVPQKEEEKTTITLNKKSIVLVVGQSETLEATVFPAGKSENIIWASSLQNVANVNADGKVTAAREGTSTITAKADGAKTTCMVTVIKKEVESISIKSKPTKTDYFVGDKLDITGISVEVKYNDGITSSTIGTGVQAECDMSTPGENKVVTVSFGGKETSYTINVFPKEVKMTSISVATKPDMVNYRKGQTLQTKGLTLTATYDNGTTGTITSGFDWTPTVLSTMGQQKITVSYGGFQTSFQVSVLAEYKVTVVSSNSNYGQVSISEEEPYLSGETITLTATPKDGCIFEKWSDGNTQKTRTVTVNGDATYKAVFYGRLSNWETSIPSGAKKEDERTMYRAKKTLVTSDDNPGSGYTLMKEDWVLSSSGSVMYREYTHPGIQEWGSVYEQCSGDPKSEYEYAGEKLEIDDDYTVGYMYWHWCRGERTAGAINRKTSARPEGEFDTYHVYYDTTAPDYMGDSVRDSSAANGTGYLTNPAPDGSHVHPNNSCCGDSFWYYNLEVRKQEYSIYKKQYIYEYLGNLTETKPSDGEATPIKQYKYRPS